MSIHKMKWRFLSVLALALGLVISSCNKEPLDGPREASITEKPQDIEVDVFALPEVVKINNQATLAFGNLEHFKTTLSSIAEMNSTALNKWEKNMRFVSMRNEFERIEDRYENISTQQQLDQFRDNYRHKVKFTGDGDIEMIVDMYHVGSMLNTEGIVKIGGMVQKFTADKVISIVDSDLSKLALAETLTETDLEQNIFISPINTSSTNARSSGPDALDCESNWDSDNRRVKMSLDVDWWSTPNQNCAWQWVSVWNGQMYIYDWQYVCVPTGTYNITRNMELEVKSQKKGFLGIAFGSKADIEAKYGANVHELNGSSTINHWMPVSASETDEKKLVRSYPVDFAANVPGSAIVDYCFGPTHVAGIINSGTNCHVFH